MICPHCNQEQLSESAKLAKIQASADLIAEFLAWAGRKGIFLGGKMIPMLLSTDQMSEM